MIFVTGATGNVGTPLLARLVALQASVHALSRQPAAQQAASGVQWVQGELDDARSLRGALEGVTTLVLISPASPRLVERECAMVDAAKAAGVRRVVKLSGLGAGPQAPIRLPQAHYTVEQHVLASSLAATFVRPNLFYQTLLAAAPSIASEGVIYAPAEDGRISFTDTRDIADVIAAAATSEQHDGQVYEITGPQALGYAEIAYALGKRIGRKLEYVSISPTAQREYLQGAGVDEWTTEAFVELFGIYRAGHGSAVLAETVQRVLGRPARGLNDFLTDHRDRFEAVAEPV